MNIKTFQSICAVMLSKHYGLTLNDTDLSDVKTVERLVTSGAKPYEILNETAKDFDLYRVDIKGTWDTQIHQDLTPKDEEDAKDLMECVYLMGEEPSQCPKCQSRTTFDDLANGVQLHNCINHQCSFVFLMEEDQEMAEA